MIRMILGSHLFSEHNFALRSSSYPLLADHMTKLHDIHLLLPRYIISNCETMFEELNQTTILTFSYHCVL